MGNTDDILAKLLKDQYFTKTYLSKGYWQNPVEKSSKEKTAFVLEDGCCQLPFVLVNSGATFNNLLDGMTNTDDYVDDILSYTEECAYIWRSSESYFRGSKVRCRIDN